MSDESPQAASAALLSRAAGQYLGTDLLWLGDPKNPLESEAKVTVDGSEFRSTWSYQGKPQSGTLSFTLHEDRVDAAWTDTFHASSTMHFSGPHTADALIVKGTYSVGSGPDWGWRIEVRVPSPQELLIEMFNIHPDGQEDAAVRQQLRRCEPGKA